MLEKIKLLLNKSNDNDIDELLGTLISICKGEAYIYCNLPIYDKKLDFIVVFMVIERYNRLGSEGALQQSSSGVSMSYDSFYSEKIIRLLNKFRKIKMV